MYLKDCLNDIISEYKKSFPQRFGGEDQEKFKWEAIKHFQNHWNINAPNFKEMLEKSLSKTYGLLASGYFFAKKMILEFAEVDAEAVRAAFINLYDESKGLEERVEAFREFAEDLRANRNPDEWKNHYQNTNAISVYLWLRYPDKYYIYKHSECLGLAKAMYSTFTPKRTSSPENLVRAFSFFDSVCKVLKQDHELREMLDRNLTDSCYPDPELKTMTFDLAYFATHYYNQSDEDESEWFPADYAPGLSVQQWVELLQNKEVFTASSLQIMKRMKDYGGSATCKQLSVKYGESVNFYNFGSSYLAKRIAEKTGCPIMLRDTENSRWWPILYVGKYADKATEGTYIWKLRDELSEALDQIDLSDVDLYFTPAEQETSAVQGYWWLNANPSIWSFSNIAVGAEQSYTLYNNNGNKRRIFQNFLDAKAGDVVIGYESHPVKQVVAIARISKANDGENLYFEKVESLNIPIDYMTLKACPELERMEYFVSPQGSLFKLTKGEFDLIMDMIREVNPLPVKTETLDTYTKEDFLNQVYMDGLRYDTLVSLLHNKRNLILQGAPGVGKTFAAKRLAYSMMGVKDESRIKFVQFHQNYSYEDFVMGYKPNENGFKLMDGVFYQFCKTAKDHPDQEYFFIIDEINRGNMSKIFGELLMLIEKDYRDTEVTLSANGLPFSIPPKLYIIGMMNTADRSLAMIDYALRRRFSFFPMEPGFNSEGFRAYQASFKNETFDALIETVKDLNRAIKQDNSLGEGFCIGHSYFCGQTECTEEWMREVVNFDIIPMLQEYWFDDKQKVQQWENRLSGVFHDE